MLNYTHEPTGTTVKTDHGITSLDRRFDQIDIQSDLVSFDVTAYETFRAESVHVCSLGVPNPDRLEAVIRTNGQSDAYLAVTLDDHKNLFIPIEIAEVIAAALAAEAVAS